MYLEKYDPRSSAAQELRRYGLHGMSEHRHFVKNATDSAPRDALSFCKLLFAQLD